MKIENLIFRHSKKPDKENPEAKDFPGLSEAGVELARRKAREETYPEIKNSEPGTVVWLGGVTNLARTRSTMKAQSEEIKKLFREKEEKNIIFIDSELIKERKYNLRAVLSEYVGSDRDKIIVLDLPLMIKELTPRKWYEKDGKTDTPYAAELDKRSGPESADFVRNWLAETVQERINPEQKKVVNPTPEEEAKNFSLGLERMSRFIDKILPGRNQKNLVFGNTQEINPFLAQEIGKENQRDLFDVYNKEMAGAPFDFVEMAVVTNDNGNKKIKFRGKIYGERKDQDE